MPVILTKTAVNYLARLNEPMKSRIKDALQKLSNEPPGGDIRKLSGRDGYRARVGGYRILFDIMENCVSVYKIGPRGEVYKEH